jgi:hypothetical protein
VPDVRFWPAILRFRGYEPRSELGHLPLWEAPVQACPAEVLAQGRRTTTGAGELLVERRTCPAWFLAEALCLQLTLAQIGASILRLKAIFYCCFKYINVYIF